MRALRLSLAGLVGLLVYVAVAQRSYGLSVWLKATGQGVDCPWPKLLASPWTTGKFHDIAGEFASNVKLERAEPGGLELYSTPTRSFWIPRGEPGGWTGGQTLAYVLAEQEWLSGYASEYGVRKGDVVMDVGAHVGTFGDDALRRGAAKVIMIEASPLNAECIRRNFAAEIADGRVVLIAEGAWSSEGTLDFVTGVSNSGTGSLVLGEDGGHSVKVRVRPIDDMLKERNVDRVDFVKMDIEGAEREALKGAAQVLRKRPRLMLDAYHRNDDRVVLPAILKAASPDYQVFCAVCGESRHADGRLDSYALFYF